MGIENGNKISANDMNTVVTNVNTTHKKYGFSNTTSSVSSGTIPSAGHFNKLISQINNCISDTIDRKYVHYKGSTLTGVSVGDKLSASKVSLLSTTQANVSKDYCDCNEDCPCECDLECCDNYCSCDTDGCYCDGDGDGCDDCSCDTDCCENDCLLNSDSCCDDEYMYDCVCEGEYDESCGCDGDCDTEGCSCDIDGCGVDECCDYDD